MYLRETISTLSDGTKVKYVQLAQNYWDSEAQCSKTNIIYSFGREDKLDKEKLKGLVDNINKYLYPDNDSNFDLFPKVFDNTNFEFEWAKN